MPIEIPQITRALNDLVERLQRESKRFQDIRIAGPVKVHRISDPDQVGHKWTFQAEPRGKDTTVSASVEYYPDTDDFEGICEGEYSAKDLRDVESRLSKKYL